MLQIRKFIAFHSKLFYSIHSSECSQTLFFQLCHILIFLLLSQIHVFYHVNVNVKKIRRKIKGKNRILVEYGPSCMNLKRSMKWHWKNEKRDNMFFMFTQE